MPSSSGHPGDFTNTVAFYMIYNGMNIEQAISKAEADLIGHVPAHIKELARKELLNIGRSACQK